MFRNALRLIARETLKVPKGNTRYSIELWDSLHIVWVFDLLLSVDHDSEKINAPCTSALCDCSMISQYSINHVSIGRF